MSTHRDLYSEYKIHTQVVDGIQETLTVHSFSEALAWKSRGHYVENVALRRAI